MDANEDVVVLAVDIAQDRDDVKTFIDKNGYTMPVLLDSTGEVAAAYMVSGTPTTYFITPEGILLGGVPGYMEADYMNELIAHFTE